MREPPPSRPSARWTGFQVVLAAVAVVVGILAWGAVMPRPTHVLYLVPPILSLIAGLALAWVVNRLRTRWLAVILAVILGIVLGFIAGYVALILVQVAVGVQSLIGDDAFRNNEATVALVIAPVETAVVALIGAVLHRERRVRPAALPTALTMPNRINVADPIGPLMPHIEGMRHRHYRVLLVGGIAVFAGLTALTANTGSVIAVTAVLVVGSFFVPVVYVEYMEDIDAFGGVPRGAIIRVGLLTALCGIPAAAVLEAVEHAGAGALVPALLTGFTEEGVKILLVVLLVRHTRYRFELDGVIFGAAAGMGFAAFEDAGYAISALSQGGIPDFLHTLWLRQALGPFGHGTWTASIAAVIWQQRYVPKRRVPFAVLGAYSVSSLLHAAWDWDPVGGIAGFVWLLVVGALSIWRLRARVREAITQERRYAALTGVAPEAKDLPAPG